MLRRLTPFLLVGLVAVGCKTITEELPTASTTVTDPANVVTVPFPVTVTPITLPQPETPTPTPAPSGGGPSAPTEPEGNDDDSDEFIPDNTNPVARVLAKVFFVECGGQAVPGTENASSAPVGCRVHLDVTPKDSGGKPTQPKGSPRWSYSDPGLFSIGGPSPFNPVLQVNKAGSTTAQAVVDGVPSNVLSIRFQ